MEWNLLESNSLGHCGWSADFSLSCVTVGVYQVGFAFSLPIPLFVIDSTREDALIGLSKMP